MKKIKVIFFGTPEFVIPILSALEQNFDLVAVVTNPDKPVGRHQTLTPSFVKLATLGDAFRGCKAKIFTPAKLDSKLTSQLSALNPDLFVVASYGKIIPKEILDLPKFGAINVHPSLLPKYRGASPIQSAILNGNKTSGISIIKMDEKMDHGPIIYAEEFGLSNLDTFESLSTNMFARSAEILSIIIPQFVQNLIPAKPQNEKDATYTKIIKKEDGFFDISDQKQLKNLTEPRTMNHELITSQLDRMIRAYYPWPTAWSKWNGKIVKFIPTTSHPEQSEGSQKKDSSATPQNDRNNFLIQIEGKKPVTLAEFLNGNPNFPLKNLFFEK